MTTAFGSYHPLNVLKPVADNVWVVDAFAFQVVTSKCQFE